MRDRRPELTLICVMVDRVMRVDLDAAFAPIGQASASSRAIPPGTKLSDSVALALTSDVRPAARTWVLSETVWTQTLDLPEPSIAALSAQQIDSALAFEVEPVSGIPATSARIGSKRVAGAAPGRVRFWMVLVPADELEAIAAQLTALGSQLRGVLHPAGIAAHGACVEVWDQATLCTDGERDWTVIGASAGQRSWIQGIAQWIGSVGLARVAWSGRARAVQLAQDLTAAVAADVFVDGGPGAFVEHGVEWLVDIARTLAANRSSAPIVTAPARPARVIPARGGAVALFLVVFVFVFLQYRTKAVEAQELETRADFAQRMLEQKQRMTREVAELEKQIATEQVDLDARRTRLFTLQSEWNDLRERPHLLIDAIQRAKPAALSLLALHTLEQDSSSIEGVCLDSSLPQQFAFSLAAILEPVGMRVRPANIREAHTQNGAAYMAFTIDVTPTRAVHATVAPMNVKRRVQ